jgi:RNA polymerase sigma-70 factor (ECF subfamily)
MLRSRKSRHDESLEVRIADPIASRESGTDPEHEALLADSVGLALLVVLETLTPAGRLAFVLHDIFAVPFEEIAPIVERTPTAARKLASRARRRVHGAGGQDGVGARAAAPPVSGADLTRQREVVDAFLAAARGGDFDALLAVLDPEVVLRSDRAALPSGAAREIRGAAAVARKAMVGGARAARPALVNGAVGVVVAPRGRLLMVLVFTISEGKIIEIDAVADPERLRQLDLAVLDN